jgi:hypothetical protein
MDQKPICKFPHPFAHEINANWLGLCERAHRVSHKSSPGVHQFETRVWSANARERSNKIIPGLVYNSATALSCKLCWLSVAASASCERAPLALEFALIRSLARPHQTRPSRNRMWAALSLAVSEWASECVCVRRDFERNEPFADRDTERWCTKTLGLPDVILNGRATLAQEIDSIKVTRTPAH